MADIAQPASITQEQWNTVKRAARFMATYVPDTDCVGLARLKNEAGRTPIALLDWHADALCNVATERTDIDPGGDDRLEAMERLFHMLTDRAADTEAVDWIYSAYCFFFYLERFARNGRITHAGERLKR